MLKLQKFYSFLPINLLFFYFPGQSNLAPVFTQVMNNLALSEATPVGTVVYTLEGYDPEDSEVSFGLVGTDNFKVDPKTGEVTIIKALDREVRKWVLNNLIDEVLFTYINLMRVSKWMEGRRSKFGVSINNEMLFDWGKVHNNLLKLIIFVLLCGEMFLDGFTILIRG